MIIGISDELAGACTDVTQPWPSSSARYTAIGADNAEASASPTPIAPVSTAAAVVTKRRSTRSTSAPDGTNSATTGITCTKPTADSTSLELVRS